MLAVRISSQSQYTHSPLTCTRHSWAFTRAVLNSFNRSTQREVTRVSAFHPRHLSRRIHVQTGFLLNCNDTLHVGAWSPFLLVTSRDSPVIWDVSRGPAQYAGIKPPSVNFTNLNASALPEWHSQPLPTTDSTTGSLSRTVMIRSSCNWARVSVSLQRL